MIRPTRILAALILTLAAVALAGVCFLVAGGEGEL